MYRKRKREGGVSYAILCRENTKIKDSASMQGGGDSSAAEAAVCRGDNSNCILKMLTPGIGDLASHSSTQDARWPPESPFPLSSP